MKISGVAGIALFAALCGAARADVAEQAKPDTPPAKLAGFALGQRIDVHDAAVRKSLGLEDPVVVTRFDLKLEYLSCEVAKPSGGFDEATVDLTTNGVVCAVTGTYACENFEAAKRKAAEMRKQYADEFAGRFSDDGPYVLDVYADDSYAEVRLSTNDFRKSLNSRTPGFSGERP